MITEYCRNFTPEQMNFWRQCNGVIAWNTIVPLYYQGAIAGSEFLVYNAAKIYMALEVDFLQVGGATINIYEVVIYNEANAVKGEYLNLYPVWDTTAALLKYISLNFYCKNIWFSRIVNSANYVHMKFNGFRLNII